MVEDLTTALCSGENSENLPPPTKTRKKREKLFFMLLDCLLKCEVFQSVFEINSVYSFIYFKCMQSHRLNARCP